MLLDVDACNTPLTLKIYFLVMISQIHVFDKNYLSRFGSEVVIPCKKQDKKSSAGADLQIGLS
jgi:hypothetical protein